MPGAGSSITISGITCWDEGVSKVFNRTQSVITRRLRCAYTDEAALVGKLRGSANVVGNVTVFTAPLAFPGYVNMYIDEVRCDGEGTKGLDSNGVVGYDWSLITATYTPLASTTTGQIDLDFGQQVYSMPPGSLVFAGGEPVPGNRPIIVNSVGIRQSRLNLGALPISSILNIAMNPIDSSGLFGTSAGTLMFQGGRAFHTYQTDGATNWSVEYRWQWRRIRWDWFAKSDGTFALVTLKAGGNLYGTSNQSTLLA